MIFLGSCYENVTVVEYRYWLVFWHGAFFRPKEWFTYYTEMTQIIKRRQFNYISQPGDNYSKQM
jgi:hypothetical protein